jgi:SAM-dependent methyltransferase
MMATAAFDGVADRYDADFTHTRLGQLLRHRVWRQLDYAFQPGQHVLELGCGTGEDALWLASRGVSVLATDVSQGMLSVAHRKADGHPLVSFQQQDANALSLTDRFAGAFANFGVLNCVRDRQAFGAQLANALRPGAFFVAVVMPPFCLWETAWSLLRGDVATAKRRWGPSVASVGGAQLPVWYPSARRLQAELDQWFSRRHLEGLGTVLPPSYLARFVEGWPGWTAALDNALPYGHLWADHYILVLERR